MLKESHPPLSPLYFAVSFVKYTELRMYSTQSTRTYLYTEYRDAHRVQGFTQSTEMCKIVQEYKLTVYDDL